MFGVVGFGVGCILLYFSSIIPLYVVMGWVFCFYPCELNVSLVCSLFGYFGVFPWVLRIFYSVLYHISLFCLILSYSTYSTYSLTSYPTFTTFTQFITFNSFYHFFSILSL